MPSVPPKWQCPDCGLVRAKNTIRSHSGSRICRAQQIKNWMASRGWRPLHHLQPTNALRARGIHWERFPAYAKSDYRNAVLWYQNGRRRKEQDFDRPFFYDLGDRLFIEEWLWMITRAYSLRRMLLLSGPRIFKMQERGQEFKKAFVTSVTLGGLQALNHQLIQEGITWMWEKK